MTQRIPKSTLKRLALYHRCFRELKEKGEQKIQSKELGQIMGIEPATVRKDFSHLGELGRQGYGYKVDFVLEAFESIINLQAQEAQKCVLIGAGNLGRTLVGFFAPPRMRDEITHIPSKLVAAFDVDPNIVGTHIGDTPVHHMDDLKTFIKENSISYIILAVPTDQAPDIAETVTECKTIQGILNLTSTLINIEGVVVHEVDLALELETLVLTSIQEQVGRQNKTIKDLLYI